MSFTIAHYKTIIFDCDGVILNSNQVKTNAFYLTVLPYGEKFAQELVEYHVEHGGISRYEKFAYFIEHIINNQEITTLDQLVKTYANHVQQGLLTCDIAAGIENLRALSPARWLVVSGGDENELRKIFKERNIDYLFDGGIFGSPVDKHTILRREISNTNILHPAIFIGDSKYDYDAAQQAELDFIFMSEWTEVHKWQEWVTDNKINHQNKLSNFLSK